MRLVIAIIFSVRLGSDIAMINRGQMFPVVSTFPIRAWKHISIVFDWLQVLAIAHLPENPVHVCRTAGQSRFDSNGVEDILTAEKI